MAVNKEIIQFTAKGLKPLQRDIKTLEKQIRKLDRAYKASTKSSKGSTKSMGAMIAKLGLGYLAFRALTGAVGGAVRVGKEFEKEMSNVAAISGATGLQIQALEANAKELGRTTVFTASNVAQLSTSFAKLGFSADEIVKATKGTLALAAVARVDLGQAAAVAGTTLRAFGLSAGETGRVTDVMALSFSRSALDIQKFTDSMKFVAPVAKKVGFNIEGTTAIMGALANAGIDGSLAGTALRTIFLKLADTNSDLSKRLGGSVKNAEDLIPALKGLKDEGVDLTEMLGLVDKRAVTAFSILVDGTNTVGKLKDQLDNAAGSAERMAEIQLNNLAGSMTILKSATEGLGIALFENFEVDIRNAVEGITDMVSGLTQFIAIPVSEKISQEKDQFNILLGILEDVNTEQDTRNRAIEELQKNYPDYIKNIDLESASQEQLKKLQADTNKEFLLRIQLEAKREILAEHAAEALKIQKKVFELEVQDRKAKEGKLRQDNTLMGIGFRTNNQLRLQKERLAEVIAENEEFIASLGESGYTLDATTGQIVRFGDEASNTFEKVESGAAKSDVAVTKAAYSWKTFNANLDIAAASSVLTASSITSTTDALGAAEEAAKSAAIAFISAEIQKAVSTWISSMLQSSGPAAWLVAPIALAGGAAFGSLMGSAISRISFAATGADEVVTSPTMFIAGEAGAEHVQVTPLGGAGSSQGAGVGGQIVINISAPLVDETVVDSIIPAIAKAQRLGLA